jgi:DNA-binding Lrp family transcriptional regulator
VADDPFRLLVEVSRDPLASYAALARRAQMEPKTVQRQFERLSRARVLQGFTAIPHAAIFGRTSRAFGVAPERSSRVSIGDLVRCDPVVWAARTAEGWIYFVVHVEDATAPLAPEILRVIHGEPPIEYTYLTSTHPGPDSLNDLDRRIIGVMLGTPRAGIDEICAATGLSPKTVRRRRELILARGDVKVYPVLRSSMEPGALYYHVAVELATAEARKGVLAAAKPGILVDEFDSPRGLYLFCTSRTLPEQHALADRLRSAAGVRAVRVVINLEYEVAVERLRSWIHRATP